MVIYSVFQKLVSFCLFLSVTAALVGCKPVTSTENLESDQFTFSAYVGYAPATGEGTVSIDIEYDEFLQSPISLSLGDGDAFVVSSGENTVTMTGSDLMSVPMTIEPASEISVDYQRNGESLKRFIVNVDESLFPSIVSNLSILNGSSRQLNATLNYGILLPYQVETGIRFGYGLTPDFCFSEETGLERIGGISVERSISSPLDEATLNPQVSADRLIATQYKELLTSGLYEYCDMQLYSFVDIAKPFGSETSGQTFTTEYVSFFEEGDFDGRLSIRLVSEPVALQIDGTSLSN